MRATTLGATSATDFVDIDRIRVRACWDGSNITQAATGGRLTGVAYPSANTTVIGQVQVNLRGTGAPAWKGTTYQFEGGSEQCIDTGNHTGSAGGVTADHFFPMTAPATRGVYDLTFRAYPNDDCTGTPLAPFTLTDAMTVGIFGDSFGRDSDGVYTENAWTDGGPDCTIERVDGIIDFDAYLQVRQGCEQQKVNINTAGLQNIHLKYRWGWDTTAAVTNGLQVQWKESSSGTWQNVGTGSHNLGNSSGSPTIPNSADFDLGDDADDTSIDIKFKGNTNADALKALVDDVVVTGDPAPQAATVTVHKDFSDDNDDAVSVDLTDCSSGTDSPAGAQSATDEDNVGGAPAEFTVGGLSAGTTCTVVESPVPAGYTATYGGDCDAEGVVTLAPGDDADCTVTNTLNSATVTVHKDFSDDNDAKVSVSLDCTGGVVDSSPKDAQDEDLTPTPGDPAVFTVTGFDPDDTCDASEGSAPSGYSKDEAGCQDLDLEPDGTPSCTITNTLNSATITVDKVYSPAGPTGAVDISLQCNGDGQIDDDSQQATPGGPDAVFTITGFTAGDQCNVSEPTIPAGYHAIYGQDCKAVELAVDGAYDCTVTNTLNSATVTVHKDFSDDNDDSVSVSLTCTGDGDVDSSPKNATDEDNASGAPAVFTVTGFAVGDTCTVSETVPAGYTATYGGADCDSEGVVTLEIEGSHGCTITNTLNSATITVDKVYSPTGPTGAVDISLQCNGDGEIDDDSQQATPGGPDAVFTITGFAPGDQCNVSEPSIPAGYHAIYGQDCKAVELAVDGAYDCTVTNTLNSATVTVDKVYSPAGPTDAVDVGLQCDGGNIDDDSQQATPGGPDAVFTVTGFTVGDTCTVTETSVPPGYTASYGGTDCDSAGVVTLGINDSDECTITNTLNSATVTVHKDFSDDNDAKVSVSLDCTGGVVDSSPKDAQDEDNATPGAGCVHGDWVRSG